MIYSIRGATTSPNIKEEILKNTKVLFDTIVETNKIDGKCIVNIFVSSTIDITKVYPAYAIRQSKYYDPSTTLFSQLEPNIDGALANCIRLLVLYQSKTKLKVKHIYQRGARILRPDICNLTIALDGPSGAGKSTLAKILADKLGIPYLDTGAMYRALALKMIRLGVYDKNTLTADQSQIVDILNNTKIDFGKGQSASTVYLDGQDVTDAIRQHSVSKAASDISALITVRLAMVDMQRKIASKCSCVLDGRDIGTFVLPNADYKFFIDASIDCRAMRRMSQLQQKGELVSFEQVKTDIAQRDYNDANRQIAPLKRAEDAILIDTTDQKVEESIEAILKNLTKRQG